MGKAKTHEQFVKEVYDITNNLEVIGLYKNSKTKIKCKCKKCNHIWNPLPSNLLRGQVKCPACVGNKLVVGKNSFWDTNPEQAKFLLNAENGYKYTRTSKIKVDWICPTCSEIIRNKLISYVNKKGIPCPMCSFGVSYPEKYVFNILKQIGVNFESQKTFAWSKNKRYDFYLFDYNAIIEVHGKQHYDLSGFPNTKLYETKENDLYKRNIAIKNGISNYIVIDARTSECNYIKNSIIRDKCFNSLFDIKKIDFKKAHMDSLNKTNFKILKCWNNGIKDTLQIAEDVGVSRRTVTKCLSQLFKIGVCDYNINEVYIQNANRARKLQEKEVICVTTGKVYKSASSAARNSGANVKNISACCLGKKKSAGKKNGVPLIWKYINDKKHACGSPICVSQYTKDGIFINRFKSIREASLSTNANKDSISKTCKGKQKTAGGFVWVYDSIEEVEF